MVGKQDIELSSINNNLERLALKRRHACCYFFIPDKSCSFPFLLTNNPMVGKQDIGLSSINNTLERLALKRRHACCYFFIPDNLAPFHSF